MLFVKFKQAYNVVLKYLVHKNNKLYDAILKILSKQKKSMDNVKSLYAMCLIVFPTPFVGKEHSLMQY